MGVLEKVVDGDTVHFKTNGKKVKCRIAYIDTPESYINSKLKKDIKLCSVSDKKMVKAGKLATAEAKKFLKLRQEYEYEVIDVDHYKRSVCVVKLSDGSSFGDTMIKQGFAVPYRKYIPFSQLASFNSLVDQSRLKKIGLWSEYPAAIDCLDKIRK